MLFACSCAFFEYPFARRPIVLSLPRPSASVGLTALNLRLAMRDETHSPLCPCGARHRRDGEQEARAEARAAPRRLLATIRGRP